MKNGQEPDLTAEVSRDDRNGLERRGDGVEQDGMVSWSAVGLSNQTFTLEDHFSQ
jgi:hypothetical protein